MQNHLQSNTIEGCKAAGFNTCDHTPNLQRRAPQPAAQQLVTQVVMASQHSLPGAVLRAQHCQMLHQTYKHRVQQWQLSDNHPQRFTFRAIANNATPMC